MPAVRPATVTAVCGRYTAAPTRRDAIADRLGVALDATIERLTQDRYNVAPRQQIAVVEGAKDGGRHARGARWGLLPRWAKTSRDRLQPINARADRLLDSKMWRPLLANASHRVIVPATGWYEWLHSEERGEWPAPFHHVVDGGEVFGFAGLLNTTRVDDLDQPITTATIITTDANGPASQLHDRMPVVLAGRAEHAAWLFPDVDAEDAMALLVPLADDRVTLEPASRRVNNVRNDGRELLDAATA